MVRTMFSEKMEFRSRSHIKYKWHSLAKVKKSSGAMGQKNKISITFAVVPGRC